MQHSPYECRAAERSLCPKADHTERGQVMWLQNLPFVLCFTRVVLARRTPLFRKSLSVRPTTIQSARQIHIRDATSQGTLSLPSNHVVSVISFSACGCAHVHFGVHPPTLEQSLNRRKHLPDGHIQSLLLTVSVDNGKRDSIAIVIVWVFDSITS